MSSASASQPGTGDEHDRYADLPAGLRLCYRIHGQPGGTPVLLIAGLGLQLVSWPRAFVDAFVQAGCLVVTPDNRDAGRSSRLPQRPPGKLDQILGRARAEHYALEDMAEDMQRLLDHLALPAVHLVGMSMGGMIAQTLAARHPGSAASLTSIFSNTGAARVGRPALSTMWRLSRPAARTLEEAVASHAGMMRHIGDPHAPGIEAEWSAYARLSWARNGNRANAGGVGRQIGAILKSGDRTTQLHGIRARTLVIHGDVDRLVHPSGGHATAAAIPGARLVTVHGMRHQIDSARSPQLGAMILAHMQGA